MADGGGGGSGKYLAGCGCLTWLGAVLLIVLAQVLMMLDVIPYELYSVVSITTMLSGCCASLAFIVAVVGIVMMLLGGRGAAAE